MDNRICNLRSRSNNRLGCSESERNRRQLVRAILRLHRQSKVSSRGSNFVVRGFVIQRLPCSVRLLRSAFCSRDWNVFSEVSDLKPTSTSRLILQGVCVRVVPDE